MGLFNKNYTEEEQLEMEDIKLESLRVKAHRKMLQAFPDCRDPDHPGCPDCDPDCDPEI